MRAVGRPEITADVPKSSMKPDKEAKQAHAHEQGSDITQARDADGIIVDMSAPEGSLHADSALPPAQSSAASGGAASVWQDPWTLDDSSTGAAAVGNISCWGSSTAGPAGAAVDSTGAGTSSTGASHPEEPVSVVAQLQRRVLWAKVWVTVFAYGFDA